MKITREQLKELGACDEFCDGLGGFPIVIGDATRLRVSELKEATGGDIQQVYTYLRLALSKDLVAAFKERYSRLPSEEFAIAVMQAGTATFFGRLVDFVKKTPECPEHRILFPEEIPGRLQFKRGDIVRSPHTRSRYLVLRDTEVFNGEIRLKHLRLSTTKRVGGRCNQLVGNTAWSYWNEEYRAWSCVKKADRPLLIASDHNYEVIAFVDLGE